MNSETKFADKFSRNYLSIELKWNARTGTKTFHDEKKP